MALGHGLMAQAASGFNPVTEGMQIVSDCEVVLANSLGDAISPLVSTQLKQLYAHLVTADGGLEVRI